MVSAFRVGARSTGGVLGLCRHGWRPVRDLDHAQRSRSNVMQEQVETYFWAATGRCDYLQLAAGSTPVARSNY